jgi:F-type H+-transporting ATPase subunit b
MENQIAEAAHQPGIMAPEITMLILTWVAFISLLIILHKFAWKPILSALDAREEKIRKSVDEAEKIKAELIKIEESRLGILREAENKSRQILDDSRKAAVEAAKVIQEKAREEGKILIENAVREIGSERDRAQAHLKALSAQIAVGLAQKILEENIDEGKNSKLIDEYLKKI